MKIQGKYNNDGREGGIMWLYGSQKSRKDEITYFLWKTLIDLQVSY